MTIGYERVPRSGVVRRRPAVKVMACLSMGVWLLVIGLLPRSISAAESAAPTGQASLEGNPAAQSSGAGSAVFSLKSLSVRGSTLLPEKTLNQKVGQFIGPERTLADLRRAAAVVQDAYRDAGYGGVVAYVPEQDLSAGEAFVQVVEGKVGVVSITGNSRFDSNNIRRSLPALKEGKTPLVRAIDRDIQLANENPAKEVKVRLKAGSKPGEVDSDVEVVEQSPLRILLGVDNTGQISTGRYRASLGLQHANLWNRDHIGTLQYQTSPSHPNLVKIYSASYRAPIYGFSSSVDAFYAHSTVDNGTTETVAGPLQFTGTGDVAGLRFNHYLVRRGEYDHHISLGADWRSYDNECTLSGFGSAGCGSAGVDITSAPLTLTYTGQSQGSNSAWGTSLALSHNVAGSNEAKFHAARADARRNYSILRISGYAVNDLATGWGFSVRISAQYTPDALISGEQLGLGGAGSVRGYREREIGGDSGVITTLELLGPEWAATKGAARASIRPLVFADYGWVTNNKDALCRGSDTDCSLSSVGLGVRFGLGKWLGGKLELGYTLQEGSQTESDQFHAHVALNVAF